MAAVVASARPESVALRLNWLEQKVAALNGQGPFDLARLHRNVFYGSETIGTPGDPAAENIYDREPDWSLHNAVFGLDPSNRNAVNSLNGRSSFDAVFGDIDCSLLTGRSLAEDVRYLVIGGYNDGLTSLGATLADTVWESPSKMSTWLSSGGSSIIWEIEDLQLRLDGKDQEIANLQSEIARLDARIDAIS